MAGPAFLSSTSVPLDNAAQAGPGPLTNNRALLGTLLVNDFVFIPVHQRLGNRSENYDFTNTGGQTWTFFDFRDHATVAQNLAFWCCRFNGTWTANPAIEQGDGDLDPMTAPITVFRPSDPSKIIDVDFSAALVLADFAATTTPTVAAITTRHDNALAVVVYAVPAANTWSSLSAGWTYAIQQLRNTSGSGMSFSMATKAIATAGTTGSVTNTQSSSVGGIAAMFSLYERDATQDFTQSNNAVDLFTDFEQSTDGTAVSTGILNAATRLSSNDGGWSFIGAGGPNLKIANAAQMKLAPRNVKLSGTTYDDATGGRGMQLNHQLQGGNPYIAAWQKTSGGYAKLSMGFFFTTELDYATFTTITPAGIQESGGTMGGFFGMPSPDVGFHRGQLENTPSETIIAANLLRNKQYWVTEQYDAAANVGSIRFYDPLTWTQVGVSAVGRLAASGSTNANQVQLGDSHGAASTGTLKRSNYDGLLVSFTGVWPLGPAPLAGTGAGPSAGYALDWKLQTQWRPQAWDFPLEWDLRLDDFLPSAASPDVTIALTGSLITFSAGQLIPSATVAIAGSSYAWSAGTITPNIAISLNGSLETYAVGTLAPSASIALAGSLETYSVGTLAPTTTIALTGATYAWNTGTLTASTGGDVTVALTGTLLSFSAGQLTPTPSVALTGSAEAYSAGTLIATNLVALTGVSEAYSTGVLTPATSISLAGSLVSYSAGTLTAQAGGDVTVALTGIDIGWQTGQLQANGGDSAQQNSGGFYFDFDAHRERRQRRKRQEEERKQEAESIQTELDREIARLLYEQEAKDAERADLERIQKLADQYAGTRQQVPRSIAATLLKAQEERSRNALEQLQREMDRMMTEEEIALMMILNQ